MASGAFVEEMMREQSLLDATCGGLFDHIDDLLDFSKDDSADDVLLFDSAAPGSPRIMHGGGARTIAPAPAPATNAVEPPPLIFDAAGAQGFKDAAGGHIASVSFQTFLPPMFLLLVSNTVLQVGGVVFSGPSFLFLSGRARRVVDVSVPGSIQNGYLHRTNDGGGPSTSTACRFW
jgi:hypothetical protein